MNERSEHHENSADTDRAGSVEAQPRKEEKRRQLSALVTNTAYFWSLALVVAILLIYLLWIR